MTPTAVADRPATDTAPEHVSRRPGHRMTTVVVAAVLAAVALPALVDAYTVSLAPTSLVLATR